MSAAATATDYVDARDTVEAARLFAQVEGATGRSWATVAAFVRLDSRGEKERAAVAWAYGGVR